MEQDFKELLELYRIRAAELQGYNTLIWGLPAAALLMYSNAIYHLAPLPLAQLVVALFGFLLTYAYWRHLFFRSIILGSIKAIENKLREKHGEVFVPHFPQCSRKTTVFMLWGLLSVTVFFFVFAFGRVIICLLHL